MWNWPYHPKFVTYVQEYIQLHYKNARNTPTMANGHNSKTLQREGRKGMCSNERGITVASNVGKVYEIIIN